VQPAVHGGRQALGLGALQPQGGQGRGEGEVDLGGGPPQRPGLGGEVPPRGQRVEREPPPVPGVAEVRLEDAQGRRAGLEPGHRRRDAGAAGLPEGERQFEVGVGAGADPPEDLEDVGVAEHQGGVGLFGVEDPRGERPGQRAGGVEAERSGAAGGAQPLVQEPGEARVAQPLVDGAAGQRALPDPSDQGGAEAWRQLGPYAEQELVAVGGFAGRAAGLFHPQEEMEESGPGAVQGQQLGGRFQRESRDPAALAREPALPGQPFVEQGCEGREQGVRGPGGGCGGLRHGIASFPRGAHRAVVSVQMRRLSRMAAGAVRMCGTCRKGKIHMDGPGWG